MTGSRSQLWWLAVTAAAVGVLVWLAAKVFAGGSCPDHDPVGVASSCRGLVGSLSVRVGGAAAVAVVFMNILGTGLGRTAEMLEEERRMRAEEAASSTERASG